MRECSVKVGGSAVAVAVRTPSTFSAKNAASRSAVTSGDGSVEVFLFSRRTDEIDFQSRFEQPELAAMQSDQYWFSFVW